MTTVLRAEIPAGNSKEFKEVGFGVDFNIDIFELDADILPAPSVGGKIHGCAILKASRFDGGAGGR